MMPNLFFDTYDEGERNAIADAMTVMEAAFDPVFGEAWTAAQLSGVMMMPGTWLTVVRIDAAPLGFAWCDQYWMNANCYCSRLIRCGADVVSAKHCCATV